MTIRTVRRQFFGTSNWIFVSAAYLQRGTHCRLAIVRSQSLYLCRSYVRLGEKFRKCPAGDAAASGNRPSDVAFLR